MYPGATRDHPLRQGLSSPSIISRLCRLHNPKVIFIFFTFSIIPCMKFRLLPLTLFLTAAAFAQPAKPGFTVEQIMSSPFPSSLTAATQAPRIAWTFNLRGQRNVWVADAPGFEARQVTTYHEDDGQ